MVSEICPHCYSSLQGEDVEARGRLTSCSSFRGVGYFLKDVNKRTTCAGIRRLYLKILSL